MLEEDQAGSVQYQNIWGPDYVDDLVARTTPTAGYYVEHDANWNVTSLADTTGTVQEYYSYDPYGKATFYRNGLNQFSSSAFGMVYLFQGGRYDTATGLYNFRNRDLSPTLGRWMQLDPVGFEAGSENLYGFVGQNPVTLTDPNGEIIFVVLPLLVVGAALLNTETGANLIVRTGNWLTGNRFSNWVGGPGVNNDWYCRFANNVDQGNLGIVGNVLGGTTSAGTIRIPKASPIPRVPGNHEYLDQNRN